MKNVYILIIVLSLGLGSLTGCNEYRTLTSASKVSQLSGNPFMYQLSKTVIKLIGHFMEEKVIKSTVGKINLMSPLSGLISNTNDLAGLKDLLMRSFKIAPKKMNQFDTLANVRDLVSFVAKNGSNFNFNSMKF